MQWFVFLWGQHAVGLVSPELVDEDVVHARGNPYHLGEQTSCALAVAEIQDVYGLDSIGRRNTAVGVTLEARYRLRAEMVVGSRRRVHLSHAGSDELEDLITEMAARVADQLDTRVNVTGLARTNARGALVIEFADAEDLRRIVDQID